ncbi:TIGR02594 family protein [Mesorhizobium sp. M0118]|uniref:TIGR02594 family protein n=1 Tax=Mesorhizobium sp. M0118 TaxID=2956884 RepID=UPI003336868C
MTEPRWLARARTYVGMREIPGPKTSSTIARWLDALKAPSRDDETAWCGTFVGAVVSESGLPPIANPWGARRWLNWGVPLKRPAPGAVVVFWRGSRTGWSGHVGFVVGKDRAGHLMVLGGNQGDMVSIKPFTVDRVLGYRWPACEPLPVAANLPLVSSDGKVSTNEA